MSYNSPQVVLLLSNCNSDDNTLTILDMFNINYVTINNYIELESLIATHNIHLLLSFKAYNDSLIFNKSIINKLSSVFMYGAGTIDSNIVSTVDICNTHKHICCEFSGLSFNIHLNNIKFINYFSENMDILISINNKLPLLLLQHFFNCEIFILSSEIQDINVIINEIFDVKEYFLGIVPIAMYLNFINPDFIRKIDKFATIIIDDPLLHDNYGFLNYEKLITLMKIHNFFTTIAFIPWNYKRTDHFVANLFLNNKNYINLCVHGCNHTKGEYSNTNLTHLSKLTKLATARMIEHEKLTALPFDKVMVFPQGKFSNEAMQSLKENNYMAAINTNPKSTNLSETIKLRDYLKTHITYYSEFPLFTRNNPWDIIDISFNLFFGKPSFIVIHHEFLKNNFNKLILAVNDINARTEHIKWRGVGNIIKNIVVATKNQDSNELLSINTDNIYGGGKKFDIYIRRIASEFRDNYLSKNDILLGAANSIKKIFKL